MDLVDILAVENKYTWFDKRLYGVIYQRVGYSDISDHCPVWIIRTCPKN